MIEIGNVRSSSACPAVLARLDVQVIQIAARAVTVQVTPSNSVLNVASFSVDSILKVHANTYEETVPWDAVFPYTTNIGSLLPYHHYDCWSVSQNIGGAVHSIPITIRTQQAASTGIK